VAPASAFSALHSWATLVQQSKKTMQKDYRFVRLLGRGASGEVWQVHEPNSGRVLALKQIDLSRMCAKEVELAKQEARLLWKLSHPHIVQYVDMSVDRLTLNLVMEYVSGGDLQGLIASRRETHTLVPESNIWCWFLQIASAIQYLHHRRVLHRDVKPANILLTSNHDRALLGDLGVARVLAHAKAQAVTRIGTPAYLAPELWLGRQYSFAADIYSLGCTVYELATLRIPFTAEHKALLGHQVLHKKCAPITSRYSSTLRALVLRMLEKVPDARPTPHQIFSYAQKVAVCGNQIACPPDEVISVGAPPGTGPLPHQEPKASSPSRWASARVWSPRGGGASKVCSHSPRESCVHRHAVPPRAPDKHLIELREAPPLRARSRASKGQSVRSGGAAHPEVSVAAIPAVPRDSPPPQRARSPRCARAHVIATHSDRSCSPSHVSEGTHPPTEPARKSADNESDLRQAEADPHLHTPRDQNSWGMVVPWRDHVRVRNLEIVCESNCAAEAPQPLESHLHGGDPSLIQLLRNLSEADAQAGRKTAQTERDLMKELQELDSRATLESTATLLQEILRTLPPVGEN